MSAKKLVRLTALARETLIDVVWRQWAALGGQASTAKPAQSVVDPEALLIASLLLRHTERRLWDVLAGWTTHWARLLSVQRVKNLSQAYPARAAEEISLIANYARKEAADARWRSLARNTEIAWPPTRHSPDRPHLRGNGSLLLRLRLGFGVNMKSDILAYLITTPGVLDSVRHIAETLDYTPQATRRSVEDLAEAGLVQVRSHERPASYTVTQEPWAALLHLQTPVPPWRHWQRVFEFLFAVVEWGDQGGEISDFAFEALGRELIDKHHGAFLETGVEITMRSRDDMDFEEVVTTLCEWAGTRV